ncbi:GC-type dockerin domain-anchored protein [Nodularia spumigena]|uniref:GC-type dockerin domain-anchored protein n=1 Tax=Nodularia spumigena TaxID=70799 RepID=UPI002B205743|nr:GC-type dockerin domain-anchored protein [Nodularia spumigena]MEA5612266.1 GC-type dockerin domain-anchored protein [Nodularia spumigena UHCC 0040]
MRVGSIMSICIVTCLALFAPVAKSQNCGWQAFGSSAQSVQATITDPQNPTRVIQGGENGAWELVNGVWTQMGTNLSGISVRCFAFYDTGSGPILYAGTLANGVYAWDGSEWNVAISITVLASSFDGTSVEVMAVYDDGSGEKLYIGGNFVNNVLGYANLVSWNGSQVSNLHQDNIAAGSVSALVVWDGLGESKLIIGGTFETIGDEFYDFLATWDGSSWGTVGPGAPSAVYAMVVHETTSGNVLVVAGDQHVTQFQGNTPTSLGSLDGTALALQSFDDGFQRNIYMGGSFTEVGGVAVNRVAAWDGTNWEGLGSGVNGTVISFSTLPLSGKLVVGGTFTQAGLQQSISKIGTWSNPQSACPADVNEDCQLTFFDVSLFFSWLSASDPRADFNGDGLINFFDQSAFINAYNAGCP